MSRSTFKEKIMEMVCIMSSLISMEKSMETIYMTRPVLFFKEKIRKILWRQFRGIILIWILIQYLFLNVQTVHQVLITLILGLFIMIFVSWSHSVIGNPAYVKCKQWMPKPAYISRPKYKWRYPGNAAVTKKSFP